MLHGYHVIYGVRYYPRFHVTAVGLGMYYPWIRGHTYVCLFYVALCFLLVIVWFVILLLCVGCAVSKSLVLAFSPNICLFYVYIYAWVCFGSRKISEAEFSQYFFQTAHLDGPKNAAIARARVELQKIQVILSDINSFTTQLLVRTSLLCPDHTALNASGVTTPPSFSLVQASLVIRDLTLRVFAITRFRRGKTREKIVQ
jgi:hypothetical protein